MDKRKLECLAYRWGMANRCYEEFRNEFVEHFKLDSIACLALNHLLELQEAFLKVDAERKAHKCSMELMFETYDEIYKDEVEQDFSPAAERVVTVA